MSSSVAAKSVVPPNPQVYVRQKRKWPLGLCDCRSYVDTKGKSRFWPDFCCYGMICTNVYSGKLCSKVYMETPCFCHGMGLMGCTVCLITTPLSCYHPISTMAVFCCLSNHLRAKVRAKYNVQEEDCCPCCCKGPCNDAMNYFHYGCNYPCSLFQIHMSMEKWDLEPEI